MSAACAAAGSLASAMADFQNEFSANGGSGLYVFKARPLVVGLKIARCTQRVATGSPMPSHKPFMQFFGGLSRIVSLDGSFTSPENKPLGHDRAGQGTADIARITYSPRKSRWKEP